MHAAKLALGLTKIETEYLLDRVMRDWVNDQYGDRRALDMDREIQRLLRTHVTTFTGALQPAARAAEPPGLRRGALTLIDGQVETRPMELLDHQAIWLLKVLQWWNDQCVMNMPRYIQKRLFEAYAAITESPETFADDDQSEW